MVPVDSRGGLGAVSPRLAGSRCPAGVSPGSTMRRGAMRRSTTAAGLSSADGGGGAREAYVARPVWAPALVAWYGGGGGRLGGYGAGVRLGPARLARSVHSRLAQLLEPLLEQLQPAVRGERRRASATARRRITSTTRCRGPSPRVRRGVRFGQAGRRQSRQPAGRTALRSAAARERATGEAAADHDEPLCARQRRADSRVERLRHDEADGGVAAAPGHLRARRSGAAMGQTVAGIQRGRIAAAELRSALTRSAGAKRRRKAATHRAAAAPGAPSPGSKPQTAIAPRIRSMSRRRIRTAPCRDARVRRRRWRRIAAASTSTYVPDGAAHGAPAQPRNPHVGSAHACAPRPAAPTRDVGAARVCAPRPAAPAPRCRPRRHRREQHRPGKCAPRRRSNR